MLFRSSGKEMLAEAKVLDSPSRGRGTGSRKRRSRGDAAGGRGWIHGNGAGDLIRIELGGGDAGGGGLTCEGAGAGVVVAISYADMMAEMEVAWAAAAAVSPMRCDSRAKC